MKKFGFIILTLAVVVALAGCGKKQEALEQMQQPMAPEDLSRLKTESLVAIEVRPEAMPQGQKVNAQALQSQIAVAPIPEVKLEPLPPSGPFRPAVNEIQTALKNAGLYIGKVDGKAGPMTKKAVEEFQKANNLKVDGKVGPKTWSVLSQYLNQEPAPKASTPLVSSASSEKR
ncbi:MAG: peptidoglycan-binding domain-containing protein [Candidatus Omnitrophota bacterium]